MSMFDEISFDDAPVKCRCGHGQKHYQTKSLENCLISYKVTKAGRLKIENANYRKARKSEQTKIGEIRIPFAIKERKGWKSLNTTTTIYCYSSCDKCEKIWFDIVAIFVDGKLYKINTKGRKI